MRYHAKLGMTGALLLMAMMPDAPRAQSNVAAISPSTDTVEQRTFFSAALQRQMPYQVVLPAGYASGARRYAVLYLLHGWQGDETNWIRLTHLVDVAARYPLIVVTPR